MKLNKVNFKQPLTIIIPLHNKEENIVETLQSIFQYINAPELQIIIIENGSTDNSKIRALEVIDANKVNQDILFCESKIGLGNALIKGFSHSKHEWIYVTPADFSFGNTDIEYVDANNLYEKYDLFIGSKSHNKTVIQRSFSRKIYSGIYNGLLKLFFSVPFKDTQGTLIFNKNILKKIPNLYNESFFITSELVIKAHVESFKIIEIPVVDLNVETKSTVKPVKDGLKMLFNLIKLRVKTKS